MKVRLTNEAVNCLRFWQGHPMYEGSLSEVILKQMQEWLSRDNATKGLAQINLMLKDIKAGRFR